MRNINFNSDRSESNLQIPLGFRACRNFFFDISKGRFGERIIEVSNVEELRVAQKFVGSSRLRG